MRGQKYEFTQEQIDYIINNWGVESAHSMKKKFGCSWYAVCNVAKEHGLEMPDSNAWTEQDIKMLEELSSKYHYKEIAKIMSRSENAIYLKAKRLGIVLIQDGRKWTKEEEQKLSDEWGNKSIETIAKNMKRTVFSLKVKAIRMGLGSMLDNNYDIITISDLEELLNVTRDRISRTWVKLGLNVKQKRLTKNMSYFYVTWTDLMIFLEQNQDEWDSRCVEENMLGFEPDWLQEKRKRDIEENPLWYRTWTNEEIREAINLFNSGKTYEEIASLINRSEMAVAITLRSNGCSYRMPKYWKGNELKFLKDNYQTMTYKEIGEYLGRTAKAVGYKAEQLGYIKGFSRTRKKEGSNNG